MKIYRLKDLRRNDRYEFYDYGSIFINPWGKLEHFTYKLWDLINSGDETPSL